MAAQGLPWDLMAWGFAGGGPYEEKNAVQLMQEATVSFFLGGGFQVYLKQNKDGSVPQNKSNKLAVLSEFMEKRRFCYQNRLQHKSECFILPNQDTKTATFLTNPLPQSGLIGALNLVLDAGYTANIVLEYQLDSLSNYDIAVVPEWEFISDDNKNKLLNYARSGGKLLIIGAHLSEQFGKITDYNVKASDGTPKFIMDDGGYFSKIRIETAELPDGEDVLYSDADLRCASIPSYSLKEYGDGKIAYIPFGLGTIYNDIKSFITVNFMKKVLGSLSAPLIKVNKSHIDITMQKTDDGCLINLVNMRQARQTLDVVAYDEVPEVYGVEVTLDKEYENVTMPLGEKFELSSKNGKTVVKLDKLYIHSIISVC